MTEDIPFVRVIRLVPKEMSEKLPATYHNVLDTKVRWTGRIHVPSGTDRSSDPTQRGAFAQGRYRSRHSISSRVRRVIPHD